MSEKEGWGQLFNADTGCMTKKWHYFRKGLSLCGRYMYFGRMDLSTDLDTHPDNCKKCMKIKLKENEDV